jgi:uncharacterized protein
VAEPRFIDPSITTWPSDPAHLLGGQCQGCGVVEFPTPRACPACGAADIHTIELPNQGTIWTYTVQGFPPPAPPYLGPSSAETFRPFAVAYVELGPVLVEGPLVGDPATVRIGDAVTVVFPTLGRDAAGCDVVSFAFDRTTEDVRA